MVVFCFSGVVVCLMLFSALFSFDVPFAWLVVSSFRQFSFVFVVADLLCVFVADLLCFVTDLLRRVAVLLCVVVDLLCVVAELLCCCLLLLCCVVLSSPVVSLAICRHIEVFG